MEAARFVTFEGGEGGGKTTQAKRLQERLAKRGIAAILTREPGGSPGAEDIRKILITGEPSRWDPLTEALLHFAARREHVERTIRPALGNGEWVISDRFFDSTMAYQGYAQGLGAEVVESLRQDVLGTFAPDLTIILDLPVEDGLAREQARGGSDRYGRMGLDFHRRVREAFLDIAAYAPKRCVVLDATKPVDSVAANVWTAVEERLLNTSS